MRKRYNTPHRSRVVKTRMTEEEYAEFAERISAYNMSQAEFIRQAITGAAIRPIITVSPVNDELLAAVGKLTAEYGRIGGNLLCCSAPSGKSLICLERMQKNGRRDNSLCTGIKSGIEILSVNKKEMTLSGNHVKGGGSYESPSLYMGHVVERCADRSTGRLLQISYVVHVVLIPAFFL